MQHISVSELDKILSNKQKHIQLIDVREDYELDICKLENIIHIPLNDIPDNADKIQNDVDVIFICRSGVRSAKAIEWLEENYPLENLYNLEGGMIAWINEIDASMAKY